MIFWALKNFSVEASMRMKRITYQCQRRQGIIFATGRSEGGDMATSERMRGDAGFGGQLGEGIVCVQLSVAVSEATLHRM